MELVRADFSLLHGKDGKAGAGQAILTIEPGNLTHVLVHTGTTLVARHRDFPAGFKQVRQEGAFDGIEVWVIFLQNVGEDGVRDQT